MKRLEINGAYALGVLIPLLETLRRGTDTSTIAFYVDDYIAGAALLLGAWCTARGLSAGRGILIGAWGILCGGAYGSVFSQIENPEPTDGPSGIANGVVVLVKGVFFGLAIAGLVLSITRHGRIGRAEDV